MRLTSIDNVREGQRLGKTVFDETLKPRLIKNSIILVEDIQWLKENDIQNLYVEDEISVNAQILPIIGEDVKLLAITIMKQIMDAIIEHKYESINYAYGVEWVAELILNELNQQRELKYFATELIGKDLYLYDHAIETAILSMIIGKKLAFSDRQLMTLGMGALLSDVGKAYVPWEILNKTEKLTRDELDVIRNHVHHSMEIAEHFFDLDASVLEIIKYHHERLNGTGYPHGCRAEALSLPVRMVSVCDMYTAMVTDRGYNNRKTIFTTLEILTKMAPFEIDMDVLQLLNQVVDKYPIGTVVQLSNGSIGIIKKINVKAPSRPVIDLITNGQISGEMDLMADLTLFIKETLSV